MLPSTNRCTAICQNGTPCKNSAQDGRDLCGIHIRSNRHAVSKAIQRGADTVKGLANVVTAAAAVAKAAQTIADNWSTISEVLSYYLYFLDESTDMHRSLGDRKSDTLAKAATAFEKVTTLDAFRSAAHAFESSADFFLLAADAIERGRNLPLADQRYLGQFGGNDPGLFQSNPMQDAITDFKNLRSAHEKFVELMRVADPELHSKLSATYRFYASR